MFIFPPSHLPIPSFFSTFSVLLGGCFCDREYICSTLIPFYRDIESYKNQISVKIRQNLRPNLAEPSTVLLAEVVPTDRKPIND